MYNPDQITNIRNGRHPDDAGKTLPALAKELFMAAAVESLQFSPMQILRATLFDKAARALS
jgi:hypothetical protein